MNTNRNEITTLLTTKRYLTRTELQQCVAAGLATVRQDEEDGREIFAFTPEAKALRAGIIWDQDGDAIREESEE